MKVRIRGLNRPEFYATFPTKEVCIRPGMVHFPSEQAALKCLYLVAAAIRGRK
jgi:hypothetical protein